MSENKLAAKLRAGETALGVGMMYPSAGIIEGMCPGWDFVWIDGQHGQFSYDTMLHAVQTADATGISTVVRVPGHDHGFLGPAADLAPSAIMVPMVNTPEEARFVVQGLRFPPNGVRSYGGRRVIDLLGRDYYREQDMLILAQVETLEAVEAAEAIARTEGVDALFFGPDDMRVRMGLPIDTPVMGNKQLRSAMEATARAARAAGKHSGCVVGDGATLRMAVEMGYRLIASGSDIYFLRTGAASRLKELQTALAAQPAAGGPSRTSGIY